MSSTNASSSTPNEGQTRAQREARHFDRIAQTRQEAWWGAHTPAGRCRTRQRLDWMLGEMAPDAASRDILEVGCADGMFSRQLLERIPRSAQLMGIDVSEGQIALARSNCERFTNGRFEVRDATNTGLPDRSFDYVIGFACLHHLDLDDALEEFNRILRPEGKILFAEPNMANPQVWIERNIKVIGRYLQNSPDETAFYRWSLERVLRRHGYDAIRITPFDFLHPALPERWLDWMVKLSNLLSRTPGIREIGGSLLISGVTRAR